MKSSHLKLFQPERVFRDGSVAFKQKGAGASAREGSYCELVNNDGSVVAAVEAVLSELDKVPP